MKKLVESIQRRFDAAMKDAAGRDEKKRIAGKACCYQLAAVQALIEESIVCCKDCISYESLEQLVRENSIDEVTAEVERRLGNAGMCLASLNEAFVSEYDYCSSGVRNAGRE